MKANWAILSSQASTRAGDTATSYARATDVEVFEADAFGYEEDNFVGQGDAADFHKVSKSETLPVPGPRQKQNKSHAKRQSRSLLEEPSGFHRTNRGITVRTDEEYPKLKTAELKISYALILLQQDIGYYRHVVKEVKSKSEKYGPQRFYLCEDIKTEVPGLWLKKATTVYGRISKPPPEELFVEEMLSSLPNLWAGFEEQRKKEIARITWVRQKSSKEQPQQSDKLATPLLKSKEVPLQSGSSASAGVPGSNKEMPGKASLSSQTASETGPPFKPVPVKGPLSKPVPGKGPPVKPLPGKPPAKPLPK